MTSRHPFAAPYQSQDKGLRRRPSKQIAVAGILFAIAFVGMADQAVAQNSPAVVTVHSAVDATNPLPFGFNLEDNSEFITDNHWIQDGGFAPVDNRLCLTAESGTANTFVDVDAAQAIDGSTDVYQTISSGYYTGATAYIYRFTPNGAAPGE
jgi:hypothetical protein